eukprot:TRINITY_DN4700_c0_g1_i2.p1 TRINITY_DN4700_c0_g1~~TRINITY_DN4700_c0_g1_i2.p1  ORF type:complete len:670 (+),score=73.23 TRINITY_DN4700_c0_g1_i2:34-2043(+)
MESETEPNGVTPPVQRGILRKPGEKREYKGEMVLGTQEGDEERVRDESRRGHFKRRETGYCLKMAEEVEKTETQEPEVRGILRKPGEKREPKGVMTVAAVEGDENRVRTGNRSGLARRDTTFFYLQPDEEDEEKTSANSSTPTTPASLKKSNNKNPYAKSAITSNNSMERKKLAFDVQESEKPPSPPPKPKTPAPATPTKRSLWRKSDPANRKIKASSSPVINKKKKETDSKKSSGSHTPRGESDRKSAGSSEKERELPTAWVKRKRRSLSRTKSSPEARGRPLLFRKRAEENGLLENNIFHFDIPFGDPHVHPGTICVWFIDYYGATVKSFDSHEFKTLEKLISHECKFEVDHIQIQDTSDRILPISTHLSDLNSTVLVFDLSSPPIEPISCLIGKNCRGSKIQQVSTHDKRKRGFSYITDYIKDQENIYLCELHYQLMRNKGCSVKNEDCTIGGSLKQPKHRSFTTSLFNLPSGDFANVQLFLCEHHFSEWTEAYSNYESPKESHSPRTDDRRATVTLNLTPKEVPKENRRATVTLNLTPINSPPSTTREQAWKPLPSPKTSQRVGMANTDLSLSQNLLDVPRNSKIISPRGMTGSHNSNSSLTSAEPDTNPSEPVSSPRSAFQRSRSESGGSKAKRRATVDTDSSLSSARSKKTSRSLGYPSRSGT